MAHTQVVQVQAERVANGPSEDHAGWKHKDGDLDGGANGNSKREVHLVLHRDHDRCDVLHSVACKRKQHNRQETGGQARALRHALDRAGDQPAAGLHSQRLHSQQQ